MLVIIGDRNRATAHGGTNLCAKCRYYFSRTYSANGDKDHLCSVFSRLMTLKGPVADCTDFIDQSMPYLEEMKEIAWKLEPRASLGFKVTKPDEAA